MAVPTPPLSAAVWNPAETNWPNNVMAALWVPSVTLMVNIT